MSNLNVTTQFVVVSSKKVVRETTPNLSRADALAAQAGYLDQSDQGLITLAFINLSPVVAAAAAAAAK